MAEDPAKEQAFVKYWLGQLDSYYQEYKDWEARCDKIIQRYRDDRAFKANGETVGGARFNSLWSNIQTLQPAIYIKPPKPVIERRYLDKDPIARFSSMTLERSLEVTIEECGFHDSTKRAVMDYLLCARGTTWQRYEPTYGMPESPGPTAADDESTSEPKAARADSGEDEPEEGEQGEAPRPVTWEKTYTDYVNFKNFRHSPAPTWEEVSWTAKRDFLTRKELRTRFTKVDEQSGKPIADLVPLQTDYEQSAAEKRDHKDSRPKSRNKIPRVPIWEIWDKTTRKVIFIAPGWESCALEVTDDPLKLQSFWPCQKPLYATITNDTLVPVPDYTEYQDQAQELDSLTGRINALTDAVRVNGVYDASIPELKRILQEGSDNRMIGVAKWNELASKGGLKVAMDFLPIKDIVAALLELYNARDRVKADMAEITGLSDIIRGQGQGTAKTATEQRIKGQFATLRLQDRQAEIARFCLDGIAITSEIIAEQYSPEILAEMTGMLAFIKDELKNAPKPAPQPMPPQPGQQVMGGNGPPPGPMPGQPVPGSMGAPMPGPNQGMPPPPTPEQIDQQLEQQAAEIFKQCIELLKNDKMRTFRIDIETNSTIEVDKQAEKEAVTEMVTAVGGLLEKALPVAQMMPQLVPALGQTLLFVFRRFGAGRDVEGVWEQAIDQLTQMAKNPPPKQPSPDEIKAQAEIQKQQMEGQRQQQQAQLDQQKAQQDIQLEQAMAKLEIEREQMKLQIERERLQMEREKMGMQLQGEQQKAAIQGQAAERKAALEARV